MNTGNTTQFPTVNARELNANEALVITNWTTRFENAQTRRTQSLNQVLMPIRGNSVEQKRPLAMPGGVTALAVWHLLVQFAAECPQRGLLARGTGPIRYTDLALEFGIPEEAIRTSIAMLMDPSIGWVATELCPKNLFVSGSLRKGRKSFALPKSVKVHDQHEGPTYFWGKNEIARVQNNDDGTYGIKPDAFPDKEFDDLKKLEDSLLLGT